MDCFSCAHCRTQGCKTADGRYPDFCPTAALSKEKADAVTKKMNKSRKIGKIARIAAEVEGLFYCQMTRVEETVEFLQRSGAKKVGIATCVGLINETRLLTKIFDKKGVEYYVVCCKVGAVDKSEIGIPDEHKVNKGRTYESMCNPIMQAELLNEQGTDFNIIMGLCCGHDMLFTMHSKAPVTTLVVKDRVLCHNPVLALYGSETMYSRFKDKPVDTPADKSAVK
ncbi:MAG: DUF1847 domain-containing protein [Oscillospiraceae bacterium]|jgi:uncharacterized metal-binding protein|nr:DUF1847 domain-containing protein [Oscillospiraceae bacterium]